MPPGVNHALRDPRPHPQPPAIPVICLVCHVPGRPLISTSVARPFVNNHRKRQTKIGEAVTSPIPYVLNFKNQITVISFSFVSNKASTRSIY